MIKWKRDKKDLFFSFFITYGSLLKFLKYIVMYK